MIVHFIDADGEVSCLHLREAPLPADDTTHRDFWKATCVDCVRSEVGALEEQLSAYRTRLTWLREQQTLDARIIDALKHIGEDVKSDPDWQERVFAAIRAGKP